MPHMYCRCLARAGRGRLLVSASATFCGPAQFRVWEGGLQAVDVPQWQPGCAKERAERKAERERANLQRQVRRLQGACNVSDDEAVSDEENAQLCFDHVCCLLLRLLICSFLMRLCGRTSECAGRPSETQADRFFCFLKREFLRGT